MNPNVSIIILNWNGWKDTIECLESLYQINYPYFNIILLDNGSEDNSIEKIKEYTKGNLHVESEFFKYSKENKPVKIFEYTEEEIKSIERIENEFYNISSNKKLILIKNNENYGFAEGNNIGMRFTLNNLNSDYILLLNNDTVVDIDFLDELVKVAESDEKVGIVGPKVYYYDYNGRKDVLSFTGEKMNFYISRGNRFESKKIDTGQRNSIEVTDIVEGCCMLIKREIIEKVGMLDPIYFAYWEESDLCTRVKKSGFKLLYIPNARIWHKLGVSWDTYFSYFVIYYYVVRNRLIFMWRYTSVIQKITFICFFVVYLLVNIMLMVMKEDLSTSRDGLKAIRNGISDFRRLLLEGNI